MTLKELVEENVEGFQITESDWAHWDPVKGDGALRATLQIKIPENVWSYLQEQKISAVHFAGKSDILKYIIKGTIHSENVMEDPRDVAEYLNCYHARYSDDEERVLGFYEGD